MLRLKLKMYINLHCINDFNSLGLHSEFDFQFWRPLCGPRQANLVLIAYASSEGSGELRCSLIQAVSQEEPSDRKPDPWPL